MHLKMLFAKAGHFLWPPCVNAMRVAKINAAHVSEGLNLIIKFNDAGIQMTSGFSILKQLLH